MGKFLIHIIAIISISIGALCSCATDGCSENQSSIPLAGFYSFETGESIALSELEVYGLGATGDSLLTQASETNKQVYLPFRSSSNNVAFCFHYAEYGDNTLYTDTIWFDYESMPYFASEECGAMYRYKITSTRHTDLLIDSVVVVEPEITNIDVERIKIYFTTN